MSVVFDSARADLANTLWWLGAVKTKWSDPENPEGYRLKLHDREPAAPLSPIFFNLRTDQNPKPGPLTPAVVDMIGQAMVALVVERELKFDLVAGIPNAGDPLAIAFQKHTIMQVPMPLRFGKRVEEGKRAIFGFLPDSFKGIQRETLLLVDDVITEADTKLEAVTVARATELIVNDIVVLIDREQGGRKTLAEKGVTLYAVFTITTLMSHYVAQGFLEPHQRNEILDYLHLS